MEIARHTKCTEGHVKSKKRSSKKVSQRNVQTEIRARPSDRPSAPAPEPRVPTVSPVGAAPGTIPGHFDDLYPSSLFPESRPASRRRLWPAAPPRVGRSALFLAAMSIAIVLVTVTLRAVHAAP